MSVDRIANARLRDRVHAHAALLGECIQQGLVHRLAQDQRGRHGHMQIVLGDEGLQHLLGDGALRQQFAAATMLRCREPAATRGASTATRRCAIDPIVL